MTELGKKLRIMRIESDESLKDMANRLNISPAYLSAIENGKRKSTDKFMKNLFDCYKLSDTTQSKFLDAYYFDAEEIKIDLLEISFTPKKCLFKLVEKLKSLQYSDAISILKILERKEE